MLWKLVLRYEYKNDWEKSNEATFPTKEDFYIYLSKEAINDADYAHARRICKQFDIKKLGECHYMHVQSNTLLLFDIFESFYVWNRINNQEKEETWWNVIVSKI